MTIKLSDRAEARVLRNRATQELRTVRDAAAELSREFGALATAVAAGRPPVGFQCVPELMARDARRLARWADQALATLAAAEDAS